MKAVIMAGGDGRRLRPLTCTKPKPLIPLLNRPILDYTMDLLAKHKVSEILHLLGNESTRLTALVDNMLRFVMDIYSGELNYLHEKKNNRRPF